MNITELLTDAARQNHLHPDTFEIPDENEMAAIVPGCFVKVAASVDIAPKVSGERFWVEVTSLEDGIVVGKVANNLLGDLPFKWGDTVEFTVRNVLAIQEPNC